MTNDDKIKALAELDGWVPFFHHDTGLWSMINKEGCYTGYQSGVSEEHCWRVCLPHYLTSYDAIIPLIQKQPMGIRVTLEKNCTVFDSAEQLCDALLLVTGKWKE